MQRTAFLTVCFVLLGCAESNENSRSTTPTGGALKSKNYALLIGITGYAAHANVALRERFMEDDVCALADLLKRGGYEVEVILNRGAVQHEIRKKLHRLNEKGDSDGVALVALWGYAVDLPVKDDDTQSVVGKESCFAPYASGDLRDRFLTMAEHRSRPISEERGIISFQEILDELKVAKPRHRLLLIDCDRRKSDLTSFGDESAEKKLPDGTSIIFSCSPGESSHDIPEAGHGAFVKCLLDEIRELSRNGKVETEELVARLRKKVPQLNAPPIKQTPTALAGNSWDLQLVFNDTVTKPLHPRDFAGTKVGARRTFDTGRHFRWCPPGSFMMGSPMTEATFNRKHSEDENQVQTELVDGFWIAETEVTQSQWQVLMWSTPWKGRESVNEGPDYAASYIDDNGAMSYCKKLTEQEIEAGRLPTSWKFSLPTEAQWEYACRAGNLARYSFGESESTLEAYAWFNTIHATGGVEKFKFQQIVGKKKPNAWGLYDMHGNVGEICADKSPFAGRIMRGGSWKDRPFDCRSASRSHAVGRSDMQGFRVAIVPTGD